MNAIHVNQNEKYTCFLTGEHVVPTQFVASLREKSASKCTSLLGFILESCSLLVYSKSDCTVDVLRFLKLSDFSFSSFDAKLTTICLTLKWNRLFTDVPVGSFVSSLFNLFSVLTLSVKKMKDHGIQDAEALQTGKMNSNDL